jgi:hypothetical protein
MLVLASMIYSARRHVFDCAILKRSVRIVFFPLNSGIGCVRLLAPVRDLVRLLGACS